MRIFKYVTFERLDVLRNEMIRFTQPAALNDPWEFKPHLESVMSQHTVEEEILNPFLGQPPEQLLLHCIEQKWNEMSPAMRKVYSLQKIKEMALGELKQNPQMMAEAIEHTQREIAFMTESINSQGSEIFSSVLCEKCGVLSLTVKPTNSLMWAHYTAEHKGMVIEFDSSHDFFTSRRSKEDDLSGVKQVAYSSQRPIIKGIKTLTEIDNGWEPLFFTKDISWAYEEEWRMIRGLQEADKIIKNSVANVHLFKLPAACIKGIVFGCLMPEENRKIVTEFLRTDKRYQHVKLSEAVMSKINYDLDIVEIKG